jgi:hypothetical protein
MSSAFLPSCPPAMQQAHSPESHSLPATSIFSAAWSSFLSISESQGAVGSQQLTANHPQSERKSMLVTFNLQLTVILSYFRN